MNELKCKNCGTVLGTTTASDLRLGDAVVEKVVTVRCIKCGMPKTWRPTEAKKRAA